jgi:polar amino acid transport system substrate-binding protein
MIPPYAGLAVSLVAILLAAVCPAAELEEVQRRGELIWAADQEGGGPHVFPDPADPRRITGFEVEFAGLIAGELGVKARFQQGQWDRLPLLLDQSADCVINGIELLPERRRDYGCSRPYFGYALQMVGRRAAPPASLAELAEPGPNGPWRVGVLTGSPAPPVVKPRSR